MGIMSHFHVWILAQSIIRNYLLFLIHIGLLGDKEKLYENIILIDM